MYNLQQLYSLPSPDISLLDGDFWTDLASGQIGEILLLIVFLLAAGIIISVLCYCKKVGVIATIVCCCQMCLYPIINLLPHILNRIRTQNGVQVQVNDQALVPMRGRELNQQCQAIQLRREERRARLLQLL